MTHLFLRFVIFVGFPMFYLYYGNIPISLCLQYLSLAHLVLPNTSKPSEKQNPIKSKVDSLVSDHNRQNVVHPVPRSNGPLYEGWQLLPTCPVCEGEGENYSTGTLSTHWVHMPILSQRRVPCIPQVQLECDQLLSGGDPSWPVHMSHPHSWGLSHLVAPAWEASKPAHRACLTSPRPEDAFR